MKSLLTMAALLCLAGTASAQSPAPLPDFYRTVDRAIWVVRDLASVQKTWTQLGLSDVHEYRNLNITGEYRGHANMLHFSEITGHIENLNVEIIQPVAGEHNAFSDFLAQHGDGIFAIVHKVTSEQTMQQESQRLHGLGVAPLQRITVKRDGVSATYTWFDTEPQGKYVLGLIEEPGRPAVTLPSAASGDTVTHFGTLVRDPKAVSAFWHKLGFPAFHIGSEPARADFRYRGQPLTLSFGTAATQFSQLTYEWIRSESTPANIYGDFYKSHHDQEGIQHLGFGVHDLKQAVAAFSKAGFEPVQSGHWNAANGKELPYVGMESAADGGIHVELVQVN